MVQNDKIQIELFKIVIKYLLKIENEIIFIYFIFYRCVVGKLA